MNTDLQTGQELFKPKINEYPVGARKFSSPCRTQFTFYKFRNKLTSERSEKIVKRIRILRFQTIFNILCPENGKICKKGIRKASLDKYLRILLSPILQSIENNELTLDLDEFMKEMEELVNTMTPEDRNYLIKGEKPAMPKPKSLPSSPVKFSIYERNLKKVRKTNGNLIRLRRKITEKDLKSCTFTPTITRYSTPKKYPEIWSMDSRQNRSTYT